MLTLRDRNCRTALLCALLVTAGTMLISAEQAHGALTGARFVRVVKTDDSINPGDANRFHIGEIEVFGIGATLLPGVDNANDFALSSKGAVGSTVFGTPQHGADSSLVNGALETGGDTWSRQNPLPIVAQVDLGQSVDIGDVRVWQRNDGCCQNRLASFNVELYGDDGNGNIGALVATQSFAGQVPTNSFASFTFNADAIQPTPFEEVSLTASPGESTGSGFGGNINNTLNDPFAYDPDAPVGAFPTVSYSGAAGYHQNQGDGNDAVLVYNLTDGPQTGLEEFVIDLYGRSNCCTDRDDNIDLELYSGGVGGVLVASLNGLAIEPTGQGNNVTEAVPHLRADFSSLLSAGDTFDTIRLVAHDSSAQSGSFFTLMEIRAAKIDAIVPEPTTGLLLLIAGSGALMRRRRAA